MNVIDKTLAQERAGALRQSHVAAAEASRVQPLLVARRRRRADPLHQLVPGLGSDDSVYRALAARYGLSFVAEPVSFDAHTDPVAAVRAGIARLSGKEQAAWLIAPDPAGIRWLESRRQAGKRPDRLAITTPARLRTMLFDTFGAPIAAQARREILIDGAPCNARSPLGALGMTMLVACVVTGLAIYGLGGPAWTVASFIVGIVFFASIALRLFATAQSLAAPQPPVTLPDEFLPSYTIVAPLYREAAVAAKLVRALHAIDYTFALLDIKLVVEADDHATRAALAQIALPSHYDVVVAPEGAPRTKPRALNVALPFARGELICIFDAEDEPEPDQLRKAAAIFAIEPDDLACLQAHLAIDNVGDGWLARLFAIEYAALFDVVNPGLAGLGMPMALGGTSNHFRVAALREAGGWDAWNVTEDIDLGFRLARLGLRVGELASTTHEEAPARFGPWLRQRRRWMKGWMQTAIADLVAPQRLFRQAGPVRGVAMVATLAGSILGPLFGPVFALTMILELQSGDLLTPRSWQGAAISTIWCFVFLAGLGSAIGPALIGLYRRRLLALMPWLLLLPLYWLAMTFAAWWALFDLLRAPHYWAKTEHGLARTSRRADARG